MITSKPSYRYELAAFDKESLTLEIEASPLLGFQSVDSNLFNEIVVSFKDPISAADLLILDDIMSTHTGNKPIVTKELMDKRTSRWAKVIGRAVIHPLLRDQPNTVSAFNSAMATTIWSWTFDGNHEPVIAQLNALASNGQPFSPLLNAPLNSKSTMLQYLIDEIPVSPYI